MDEKFLIDTNIIIYYLDDKIPQAHEQRVTQILMESFNISTITKIEVLGWHKLNDQDKLRIAEFLEVANVFYLDSAIEKKAIEIRQSHKMATPDTIIGATALIYNLTLVTRNEADFQKIHGLKIYNPFVE